MSRLLGCGFALILLAAPAAAQAQDSPEKLLSPTTQVYVRWDGVTAHADAYKNSIWGPVMAGPTGDSIRALLAMGPKLLGSEMLAEPLLDGKSPDELRAVHADLKNVAKVIDLIADKGVIVAAEVREPRPTIGGVRKAVTGLFSGDAPPAGSLLPEAQLLLIVPDVGDKAPILFSTLRLINRKLGEGEAEPLPAATGRTGFRFVSRDPGNPIRAGWWVEGKHFVVYLGTVAVEDAIGGLAANAAKGGMTGHPLFQRCLKTGQFESVARGFVDAGSLVGLVRRLAGPFVPGIGQRFDDLGVSNLKAIVFSSGFQGRESRALWEIDLPGERKGFAKVLKQQPLTLNDLPPMPPDVSRFSSLRVDPEAAYDAGLSLVEATSFKENFGVEDQAKNPAEVIQLRKQYLDRELNKLAGVDVRTELLPFLGDRIVMFQSPTEGLSVFGTVVCISVKDPARVRTAADRIQKGIDTLIGGGPTKVRRKMFRGVELREIYGQNYGVLTPTYTVSGDWLVIAGHPQPVQGLILRQKGELERWKPDPETAARMARMPSDPVGIQYCNPKSTAQNLCVLGPLFISTVGNLFNRRNQSEADFDPFDVGLVPNAHELSKHLFPNLTYTRDDGTTVRIEVNESFSVPLEFVGLEPLLFAALIFGRLL
jgi:hypothetical protein